MAGKPLTPPDLHLFPEGLRQMAADELEAGDVCGFLCRASNELSVPIVRLNVVPLRDRGLLERAIVDAVVASRLNNRHYYGMIDSLVACADRERLLAAGDPLPGPGPFQLYRGVGGRGPARRIRGYSWTSDRRVAEWFANRAQLYGLANPTVYAATIPAEHVLFYHVERQECDFLVKLPRDFPFEKVPMTMSPAELRKWAEARDASATG